MATIKYSRQRESIQEFLRHTTSHPTADMVYQHIRTIYPKISLGTVYRNLNLLADMGEILKFTCGDGQDRFDGNTDPHYHVMCTKCNNVFDLFMKPLDHVNDLANANFDGVIDHHKIMFYGTCKHCMDTPSESEKN